MTPRFVFQLAALLSLVPAITACSYLTLYRIEVVQGNVLTQEQTALVQPGQTKAQVQETLGSPLLSDAFHANRWDYVFTLKRQGAEPQQRRVVALFEGDVLKALEGTQNLPTERDFVSSIDTYKVPNKQRPLSLTEEQRKALPIPASPAVAASEAASAPQRTYPPLERP
jgi:outer membrane protein assembly factor BamE